jgi:LCP family protein required for cell wall assembly
MIGVTFFGPHLRKPPDDADSGEIATTLSAEEISSLEMETEPVLSGFTVPVIEAVEVDFGTGPQLQTGGGEIVNILLVGQDADDGTGTRSDSMILCTFNKKENTITLTSFLRDLYVKIPGYHDNRINAAYAFGGMQLLKETLYENFDVEVDGSVLVDFDHFERIIDLLGGVTLELTNAEARYIKKYVPGSAVSAGSNLLSGTEALVYARDRNDVDGDFSRTNRQRKLLGALLKEYKGKRLMDMLRILNELRSMVTTDISKSDLTAFAVALVPMLEQAQITTQSIPVADGFYHAKIDGKAVLVPDMEKNRQILAELLTE